jgi:uncharacterized membrane protein
LIDATGYVSSINRAGTVVGPHFASSSSASAFIWTADEGTVDLNTQVEGNLGLQVARIINDEGQILVGGAATGWHVLTPIDGE